MPRLRIIPLHLFVALLLAATGASSTEASFRGARNGGLTGLAFYPLNPPVLPIAKTDLLYPCSTTNTFLATEWFSSFLSPPQALLMLIRITNATTGNGNTMVFAVNGAAIYTAQVISSLTFGPPLPATSSLVLVYLAGGNSFSLSTPICSGPAVAYVSLQMQGYFAPAQVGGSNGAYRFNALARPMPSSAPYTRYILGTVNLYPVNPQGPPSTLMIWDAPLPGSNLFAYANLGDASPVSHTFMSRVSDANSIAIQSVINVPPKNVAYAQVGSFDPVGSDFFAFLNGANSMRLVDTRGGPSVYLSIAAPLPIATNQSGPIAPEVVDTVPAWADALVCHITVGSNSPVGLQAGNVSANGVVVYAFPLTKYSGDFVILPIAAAYGSISFSVSVPVPIVVDCFGFTGTEPLLDPNAGAPSFFNLQFIPLIKPVRLVESWPLQASLMAAKGFPNPLLSNFAYLLNALDVARAIGNNGTLRFPRAIACTLSVVLQFGNAVDVYLWDAALGPTFTPARPRLQCSTTDGYCAASVTQKLSPSAQFYFKYVPAIENDLTLRIAIDIFGFYFQGADGYVWQPLFSLSAPTFAFPTAATQSMLVVGNNTVAAITYLGDKPGSGTLAHVFHSAPIVTAYPDLKPTLAWSLVSAGSASFTGVAAVTPTGQLTMSGDCALRSFPTSCSVPMVDVSTTGVFVAPSPAGLVYTPFQEPIPFLGASPAGLPPVTNLLVYNISALPFYNVPPTVSVSFLLCAFTVPPSTGVWTLYERSVSPMYKLLGTYGVPRDTYRAEVFVTLNATGFVNLGFNDLVPPVTADIVGYFASPTPLATTTPPPPLPPPLTTPAPTPVPPTTPPPTTSPPTTPPPSTAPPTPAPPLTTASRPTLSPPTAPVSTSPPFVTSVPCTAAPPVPNALCVGGAWWVPSLEVITLNISFEPIVIGTDLHMGPDSVTVITPTYNSTIFIVANGAATVDGTLIVDLSGRVYNATYTTLAVVRAGALSGGYDTITVSNTPKSCERYSAWTAQTSTTLNAVLLRDDSNCKKSTGLGKWAAVAGGVVFGLTLIAIATLLLLLRCGVITPSSFLFLRRNEDGDSIS